LYRRVLAVVAVILAGMIVLMLHAFKILRF
jgi:hypothetical protein